jgi:hypothetical protein
LCFQRSTVSSPFAFVMERQNTRLKLVRCTPPRSNSTFTAHPNLDPMIEYEKYRRALGCTPISVLVFRDVEVY